MERDDDLVAEAGHGLVDRVVDDLVHEVVQAAGAGGADVHPRALADGLEALEDLDVAGVVAGLMLGRSVLAVRFVTVANGPPIGAHGSRLAA